jgi:hypothetical protein
MPEKMHAGLGETFLKKPDNVFGKIRECTFPRDDP